MIILDVNLLHNVTIGLGIFTTILSMVCVVLHQSRSQGLLIPNIMSIVCPIVYFFVCEIVFSLYVPNALIYNMNNLIIYILAILILLLVVAPNVRVIGDKIISIGDIGERFYGKYGRVIFGITWLFFITGFVSLLLFLLIPILNIFYTEKFFQIATLVIFVVLFNLGMGAFRLLKLSSSVKLCIVIIIFGVLSYFVLTTIDINAVSTIKVIYAQMTLVDLVYFYVTFPLAIALMPVFLQKLWTTNDDKLSKFALYVGLSIVLFIGVIFILSLIIISYNLGSSSYLSFNSLILLVDNMKFIVLLHILALMTVFTVVSVCVNSIAVTITRDIAYPLVKRIGGMDIKKVLITIQLTVLVMLLTSSFLAYSKNFSLLYSYTRLIWISMGALPIAGIYLRRSLSNKAFKFYVLINSVVLVCIVVSTMELEHSEQKWLFILAVLFSLASYSFFICLQDVNLMLFMEKNLKTLPHWTMQTV